jgi:hypothetical protein
MERNRLQVYLLIYNDNDINQGYFLKNKYMLIALIRKYL